MDPLSLGMMALSTGGGIANYFSNKGKKASVQDLNFPDYTPSPYDALTSGQLYSTLSDRVAGKNVGYSPEDLAVMNSQAVDQSAKAGNDVMARSMAGQQHTGGVSTGSTNLLREKTAEYAGGLRSNAMRDVAINNAVQKRQEINAAIPEEQGFLNSERSNAENLYSNQIQKALLQKQEADKVQAFNVARNDSANQGLQSIIGGVTSGYSGSPLSPFAGLGPSGGATQSGYGIGKYLNQINPFKTNSSTANPEDDAANQALIGKYLQMYGMGGA